VCSYCGCRANTLIARYSNEHEDIINAAGAVRRAVHAADAPALAEARARLQALLQPHTASEERSLFAELRRQEEFRETVDGLCAEHAELDALLAGVGPGDDDGYAAFDRMLRQHIDKEENGLFPASIIALDGAEWERAVAAS